MASNYTTLSFAFTISEEEEALLSECVMVASLGVSEYSEEEDKASYAERSEAFKATFPEQIEDQSPYKSFVGMFGDPYYTSFGADIDANDGKCVISGEEAEPYAIAELIRHCCKLETPVVFHWANTCSKLRLDEFGGGYYIVTKDRIYGGDTVSIADQKLRELRNEGIVR